MNRCRCSQGWTGVNCDTLINYCATPVCLNGATCISTINGPICQCLYGYTGSTCNESN